MVIKICRQVHNVHIVGIYRSKSTVNMSKFIDALRNLHNNDLNKCTGHVVMLGDFNVNLAENSSQKTALSKYLIDKKQYS